MIELDKYPGKSIESISVKEFFQSFNKRLQIEVIAGEKGLSRIIREKSINRPALALTGYLKHFAYKRLQLFGAGEMRYLRDLHKVKQKKILQVIAEKKVPCMVISRNLAPVKAMIEVANEHTIPLFRTTMASKDFIAEATVLLQEKFALTTSVHGTLMDIKGMGVLLRGKSGVGKSECALALIERGYSLVSDDLTYVKLLGDELIGKSSVLNRRYMECRGIGIINIADLFGIRAVRLSKRVDMVITFIEWTPTIHEDRTGLDQNYFEILGKKLPHVEIPVRPGRDMARLVEVATMVQALKAIGHDSAQEFNKQLIDYMSLDLKNLIQ